MIIKKLIIGFYISACGISMCLAQNYVPTIENPKNMVKPNVLLKAFGFSLADVQLLDSPFKKAMDLNGNYLLSLEPDRFLHRFRLHAGLTPKGDIYGGWEDDAISGHTLGHYLSACAMMYASTKDIRFKEKVEYIVQELNICQLARKTGYIGAIPKEDSIWREVSKGNIETKLFSLNGTWSPWYVQHKIMAGLIDAYIYCDSELAKEINIKFADWVDSLLSNLNNDQIQKMLFCEFGGMNESLVHTYAITGNKKYLNTSYKFQHQSVVDSLAMGYDVLTKKHSNTQIPKLLGSISRYELTGDTLDRNAAIFFYNTVVNDHTYVTGGNSDGEYFGEGKKMSDRLSDHTTETCNTYNMLKLNKHLFCLQPSSKLGDFYERAIYNHILASQNPKTGMVCYFTPLRSGGNRDYSSPFHSFWCCTGTGMENHAKYGEGIFYEGEDGKSIFINTFIPSMLSWKKRNAKIEVKTNYPYEENVQISYQGVDNFSYSMKIRKPSWVTGEVSISINGKKMSNILTENGFIVLYRTWKDGDKVDVYIPLKLYTESMIDNPKRVAFKYGPLVLAGVLDSKLKDPIFGIPSIVSDKKEIQSWVKMTDVANLHFQTTAAVTKQYTLKPFHTVHDVTYAVYWDIYTPKEYKSFEKTVQQEKVKQSKISKSTIDLLDFGSKTSVSDHRFSGVKLEPGESFDRRSQSATRDGNLVFEMKVNSNKKNYLMLQHSGSEETRYHDIYINDQKVASQWLNRDRPNRFIEFFYEISDTFIKNKNTITIRLQALSERKTPAVFEARITDDKF